MNDMTPWEKQLQSWTPRRPAAALKQRLFEAKTGPAAPPGRATAGPPWVWLAPAACLLVATLSLSLWLGRDEQFGNAAAGGSNLLASLSVNLTAETPEQKHNSWARGTFDWTRTWDSLSNTGSFQLRKTNILKL